MIASIAVALAAGIVTATVQDLAVAAYFPRHVSRLATDFSPTYLRRELGVIAGGPPATVFFGDSVLWGYRLDAADTAVMQLTRGGCTCANLSFKAGNPANFYVLARLLLRAGVRPKAVVLEVNQKVFNASDAEYNTLHPAVARLGADLLAPGDRALLVPTTRRSDLERVLDGVLEPHWLLYAMRSDIRETLYGDHDATPAQPLNPQMFEGTYDLSPLLPENVGVRFLSRTAELLQRDRIPLVAFLTPTNHALLHEYIDSPQYRANGAFLRRALERRGARVLDLDSAFAAGEFFDNDHLTAAGQRHLAAVLAQALPR